MAFGVGAVAASMQKAIEIVVRKGFMEQSCERTIQKLISNEALLLLKLKFLSIFYFKQAG